MKRLILLAAIATTIALGLLYRQRRPANAITLDVYSAGDTVIGEQVIDDPCHTGMTSWGARTGAVQRTFVPCGKRAGD